MLLAKSTKSQDILLHRVTKHGSHDQKTHGRGRGGGKGNTSSAGGSSAGVKGGKNAKKVSDALDRASEQGASKSDVNDIKRAYEKKDVDTLSSLEAGLFDAAVGRHGMGGDNHYKELHTATIHALKELDNSGEFDWQTLDESGDM